MKFLSVLIAILLSLPGLAQNDEQKIRSLLDQQTQSWNQGNIREFMKGYWNNDSLMFIGKSGVTYGFENTLDNYIKGYPDTTQMGKLEFNIIKVEKISRNAYFVVGKWLLKRTVGDLNGHYTLLFRKIKGEWVIVADHSS
ncbi:MAG: YybH family protein [Flavitalea sp.]